MCFVRLAMRLSFHFNPFHSISSHSIRCVFPSGRTFLSPSHSHSVFSISGIQHLPANDDLGLLPLGRLMLQCIVRRPLCESLHRASSDRALALVVLSSFPFLFLVSWFMVLLVYLFMSPHRSGGLLLLLSIQCSVLFRSDCVMIVCSECRVFGLAI